MGKYIIAIAIFMIIGLGSGFLHYNTAAHTTTYRGPVVITKESYEQFKNEVRLAGEDPQYIAVLQESDKRVLIDYKYTVPYDTKLSYGDNTGNETAHNALTISLVVMIVVGLLSAGAFLLYRRAGP